MTKLEAVNEILQAIGEPPATALDTGGTSDVADAERILDQEDRRVQGSGWAANTVPDKEYTPSSGAVSLAASVLKVRPVGVSRSLRLAIRNGALYDLENDAANTFSGTVHLEVVSLITFIQLPDALAHYIVKVAAQKFQRFKKRGEIDDAIASEELRAAKVAAMQEDGDLRGTNVLNTYEARAMRGDRNTAPLMWISAP